MSLTEDNNLPSLLNEVWVYRRKFSLIGQAAREGKEYNKALDEALSNMSDAEREAFNIRLSEISEKFGSGGP